MKFIIILLILFSTASLAKPLVIGTHHFYPPFVTQSDKDGHFSGFDIDLMQAICNKINKECIFQGMNFVDLLPALQMGHIDLSIGAISITVRRQYQYLFSYPYLTSYVQYIALSSNPIQSSQNIQDMTVGILEGTISRNILKIDHGDRITIKPYLSLNDLIDDLKHKKIELALIDGFTTNYWIAASNNILKTVGEAIRVGDGYGIAALPYRQQLMQSINQAIIELETEGTYLRIYEKYFGDKGE